jgi:hypothetical protein
MMNKSCSMRTNNVNVLLLIVKTFDFLSQIKHTRANNTSHAFRKICAPWGVTFFMATDYGEGNV